MGEIVFFLKINTKDVVRLNTVFNIMIWSNVDPEILSTPKREGK